MLYNSRTDMFALGCIIFKIVTGQMLFTSDWEVREYAQQMTSIFPNRWPESSLGTTLNDIGVLASNLLEIDPSLRPGASEARKRISRIRTGREPETKESPTSDPFFDMEDAAPAQRAATSGALPIVQPALRYIGSSQSAGTGLTAADPVLQPKLPFQHPSTRGDIEALPLNVFGIKQTPLQSPRDYPPTPAQLAHMEQVPKQLGGSLTHPLTGGLSLADYQSQMMTIEQHNQKRLQHAKAELDKRTVYGEHHYSGG